MMFWYFVLLLLVIYIYYRWGYLPYQVFKKMNLPGPPPVPFLGNIHTFLLGGMDLAPELHGKYGEMFGFYCGTMPVIGLANPLLIQNVFITKFSLFDRSTLWLLNTQATGLPPGLFEYNKFGVDHWKRVRHATQPAFTKAKLTMMSHRIHKSCLVMLDRMLKEGSTNKRIDITRIYIDCILESSILAVLGQEVSLQKGEAREFKSWMQMGTKISHGKHPLAQLYIYQPVDGFIGYQFPWLIKFYYWLGLGGYMPTFRKLKAVIVDCIKERRQKAREQKLQDTCVLNLLVADSESADDGLLSDEEIVSNCINFMFAAYDTTSLTLTCASHLLATNTHVQDKLCALLDDYWSENKDATVSDVAQEIPYLDMVLDETMRLYPAGPRIGRQCTETTEVGGVTIPKGMNVLVDVPYVHRIKSIWGDPEVFRPERFGKEESASRPPCCFLPMGLGPRNCVGLKLAKFLMKLMLVTILQHHRFTSEQKSGAMLETDCYCINLHLKSKVYVDLQIRN